MKAEIEDITSENRGIEITSETEEENKDAEADQNPRRHLRRLPCLKSQAL